MLVRTLAVALLAARLVAAAPPVTRLSPDEEAAFECLIAQHRLAGGPSADFSIRAIELTRKLVTQVRGGTGGYTFTLRSSVGDVIGRPFTAVSIYPERTKIVQGRPLTRQDVEEFLVANKGLLSEPNHNIGVWTDAKAGTTELDVIVTVPTDTEAGRRTALELGKRYNQKAIFDLGTGKVIDIPGMTGTVPSGLPPIHERVEAIRAMIPPAVPWTTARVSMPTASGRIGRSYTAIPIYPERTETHAARKRGFDDLFAFMRKNEDLLKLPNHEASVWEDPKTGRVKFEIVVTLPTRDRTERSRSTDVAWRYGQRLVYDCRYLDVVDVDQSPTAPPPLPPIQDRAKDVERIFGGG